MKYEKEIIFDFPNTMSMMISMISDESTVLEFGPASGRLTRYLKEKKNCKVYIVEIDEEAGRIASNFAEQAIIGDILEFEWEKKFTGVKFDFILFADVLEHLMKPEEVLKRCKGMLSENGKILISIPNIAHNSVIIDLLKNKFEYQSTGILDNTHIRFWSYEGMERMLSSMGLFIKKRYATYSQVGLNEFSNSYEDVPEEISLFLKMRKNGELYQYVLEVVAEKGNKTEDFFIDKRDYYYAQLFWDTGSKLVECTELKQNITEKGTVFSFSANNTNGRIKLRLDPLNHPCIVKVCCKGRNNEMEEWRGIPFETSNAAYVLDDIFWFDTDDSQIYYPTEEIQDVIIDLEFIDFEIPKVALNNIIKWKNISEQKENYINKLRENALKKDEIITVQNNEKKQKDGIIAQQKEVIAQQEQLLEQQEQKIKEYEEFTKGHIIGFLYKFFKREKR